MTRKKTRLSVLICLLLVAGAAIVWIYARYSLAAGVEHILVQDMLPGKNKWDEGMEKLWKLGPDVIPRLAAESQRQETFISRNYAVLWKGLPPKLQRNLPVPINRSELREAAMHAIHDFGPMAVRGAAPEVIAGLAATDGQNYWAVQCVPWLVPGSAAARAIFDRGISGADTNLPDPQSFIGPIGISQFWSNNPEIVPMMINNLTNANYAYLAAIALANMGSNAAPAVPALIQTLEMGAAGHSNAQSARIFMGKAYSMPAGWHMATMTKDEKGMNHNRAMAANALGRIGSATAEVCGALARAWNAKDAWVREHAAQAVAFLGPPMTNYMPQLLAGLRDHDNAALGAKLWAVGKIGPSAQNALKTLRELADPEQLKSLLADTNSQIVGQSIEDIAIFAKVAICRIDPDAGRPFLPEIVNRISYWWDPVEFLIETGPLSNDVVRAAEPLLAETNHMRQSISAYVILCHDKRHSRAMEVLRRNKSSGSMTDRLFAADWLYKSTGESNGMCELLEEVFKMRKTYEQPGQFVGQLAGQIADKMGTAVMPALPAFKAALWHKDHDVREWAARLVIKLDPKSLPINETK